MKNKKLALFQSIVSLVLCISMLVGTTFAWFTDAVVTGINTIASGVLDVELYHSNAAVTDEQVDSSTKLFMDLDGNPILWEPGVVSYENLKITNAGDLALAYQLAIATANENFVVEESGAQYGLSQILKVGLVEGGITATDREAVLASVAEADWTTLANFVSSGSLMPESAEEGESEAVLGVVIYWQPGENDNYWNLNNGKVLSSGEVLSIDLGVRLIATQEQYESDSFGDDYDAAAKVDVFPVFVAPGSTTTTVVPNDRNQVAADMEMTAGQVSASIPAGVQLAEGTTELTMSVTEMDESGANISLGVNEAMRSLDVHIEGVDSSNTVPMEIVIREAAPKGLNAGNLQLYHVENGTSVEMTLVGSADAFTAHNQFKYDPATGDIILYMATFSEVALIADTTKAWEGLFDYTWYDADANELTIANADQLAGFGAIVGGMADDIAQDSFSGKTVNLISDINLGDKESENNPDLIFYPIGYYAIENDDGLVTESSVRSFRGTFNGQGHTIANFYQNTWDMKGDYRDGYPANSNYYKDAMGLFGYVHGGTVKNLTVSNFSSDGEFTPTGVIAAYADGNSTFENIAITNCNPRVYNTGNGGIIGIAGDTSAADDDHITLKNITVDNSNKISALWGSYDVACGGLVGMYRGNVDGSGNATDDTISFENCHVAAQMDVYNDVCGNYQYYAYRYAGMIIGSVRHNTTNGEGKTIPNMTGISATGCTVNYGDWNDYYYCEFVENGHPSYSGPDDYKFSRVPNSEIDTTNGKENATCRGHDHTDVEDNQAIYLPFHQLFTGYGWGVSSVGLEKYSGVVTNLDITEGEQEGSVRKFTAKPVTELATGKAYSIGSIFAEDTVGTGFVDVVDSAVVVAITNLDEDNPVTAVYEAGTNWEDGTITFTGVGPVKITIQDYNFCTPTSVEIEVKNEGDMTSVSRFEHQFPNTAKYLYRVGNQNEIEVSRLFKAVEGQEENIGTVEISVTDAAVTRNQNYTYTPGSAWNNGTIRFNGNFTGPVTITISDDNFSEPLTLDVEVINATNITSATGTTTGGDMVLLCDVNTTTYVNYWGCTLYGNGFTYSLNGAPTAYNSKQGHGILITKNATLDNLVIVGDVYESYGAYTNQDYYNAAVDVVGNAIIQNCYISNCAAPVSARADVTIKNTTLYGGTVANLIIKSGTATLEDVTTANYDDERSLVGMGIVIHSDATEAAKLVLNGTLTQYNFINENGKPSDVNAGKLYDAMFDSACAQYHFGESPNRYVNAGIVSMSAKFGDGNIIDNASTGYQGASVKVNNVDGYVYTQPNTNGSVNNDYTQDEDNNIANTQGEVAPIYSFDHAKNELSGQDKSCYEENGTVYISMGEGDSFAWDTSILNVSKLGKELAYTVTMNGTDYTGKKITFETAGDYTVTYTYTDDSNFAVDKNGVVTTYSKTYTKLVYINVATVKAEWKDAEISVNNSAMSGIYVMSGDYDYSYKMKFLDCITITDYDQAGNASTVDLTKNVKSTSFVDKNGANPGKFDANSGTITVTYNDGKVLTVKIGAWSGSGPSTKTCSVKTNDGLYLITDGASNAANTGVTWKITGYTYTGNNGKLVSKETTVTFTWDTNSEGYNSKSSGSCVTPDTLVTLADGTQKRIDQVASDDLLMVWDFFEGKYVSVPSAIIFDHGSDNNTVIKLDFSDGTSVKVVNLHQFFDADLNKFVSISAETVADYVGHEFVKMNGNSYETVTLADYTVSEEYVEAWGIISAMHYNILVEGMLSTDFMVEDYDLFNYFEVGDQMMFDEARMQEDIAQYGLYTYEDFADYLTYEQFAAFNVPYFKVAVGKGNYTYEGILALIETYLNK